MNRISPPNNGQSTPRKKRKGIRLRWIFLLMAVTVGSWFALRYFSSGGKPGINPLDLVPENALYILETNKPYTLWTDLSNTRLWSILQKDEEWKEYGSVLSNFQQTLSNFDKALNLLSNRQVYVSIHPNQNQKTDHLFIIDITGLQTVESFLSLSNTITQRNYQGHSIYEYFDPQTREILSFTFSDQLFVASFTQKMVEAAIDEKGKASLARNDYLTEIRKEITGKGLLRLYINFQNWYRQLGNSISREDIKLLREDLPFLFGGAYFEVDEESMLLKGFTNHFDSLTAYTNLFSKSGTGKMDIASVAPNTTSVYVSLGFDEFEDFYKYLRDQLEQKGDQEYLDYSRKTEKFLNIDLNRDLASWIADEIAVIQFEVDGLSETALVLKGQNASTAKEKMDFLCRQIKRKTPVRFKEVAYRNHTINYMAVKGLFKVLLGSLFRKYDRPYYTIIDNFVIFSSRPQSLRKIIDHYSDQKTLSKEPGFETFKGKLTEDHSVLIYVQPPLLKTNSSGLLDEQTIKFIKSKNNILHNFPQMAFKISPEGNLFETNLLLSINATDPDRIVDAPTLPEHINYDSLWGLDPGEQISVTEIELNDLGVKKQDEKHPDGSVKYEVEVKDGQKHGDYFEYYPSSELKVKGKYKNDLKEGVWKYYDVDGKLIKREKYRGDKLI